MNLFSALSGTFEISSSCLPPGMIADVIKERPGLCVAVPADVGVSESRNITLVNLKNNKLCDIDLVSSHFPDRLPYRRSSRNGISCCTTRPNKPSRTGKNATLFSDHSL